MAASSSSNYTSTSSTRCTSSYDVFLSFRGLDTRYGFTDHLYTALVDSGFHTFRDDDEYPRGENIGPELCKAIYDSQCSVIIFSENYGDSESCLDELVMILDHKNTSNHVILPVFYNVEPCDVKNQTGSFAEAFARHEEQFKENMNKVNLWRKALEEAADLAEINLLQNQADRHEAKFVKNIVNEVEHGIKAKVPLDNKDIPLVGLESQLKAINSWVTDGSNDAGVLLICGLPGMGKTTIAQIVYESNVNMFTQSSFHENISSEILCKPSGLIQLQREILENLTGMEVKIDNISEGTRRIRDVVGSKRVFLVLDDVGQMGNIENIIGPKKCFYPGSKIIITTTREGAELLNAREVCRVLVVKKLDTYESLELFSWCAFGQGHPFESYKKLSERVVSHCEGHPLALKVLGRALATISKDGWDDEIKRLKECPNSEISKKLKLGYDTLQSEHDKDLFLDIACFFIGQNIDFIVTILDGFGFPTNTSLQSLLGRCLIIIDENNQVRMTDLLRDMGREITRQESAQEPGKRTRLWNDNDSYEVLNEKKGGKTIEGIVLNKINISSNKVVVETNAYEEMVNLRLLIHSEVQLYSSRNSEPFSKRLRWLCWRGFSLDSIPSFFLSQSLIAIDMCYSNLTQVWEVSKCLPKLKILDLSHSYNLTGTLDFSLLPKLEELNLSDCTSLVSVHESICTLKFLHTLDISSCSKLTKFPILEFWKMDSIKLFHANGTSISQWLDTNYDGDRSSLAIGWPQSLVHLSLKDCNLSDDDFPWEFSSLSLLKSLNLSGNEFTWLPDSIMCFNALDSLWEVSKCLPNLKILNLSHCHNLERTLDFSLFPKLKELILSDCTSLVSVHESICTLKFLHTLNISECSKLTKFPIHEFWKMDSINIFSANDTPISQWLNTNYDGVRSSLAIRWPQCLEHLGLVCCNLSDDDFLWDFSSLSSLKLLDLSSNEITRLPDCIKSLNGLDFLYFMDCVKLETLLELPIISTCLEVGTCPSLKKVTFQPALHRVEILYSKDKSLEIDIEYWCKLEPIGSVDVETINVLGLCDYLESMKERYTNIISSVTTMSKLCHPIQGIREHDGIFNVFLPGSEIPNSFSHKKSGESSMSILLAKDKMIQGLNVSTRYVVHKDLNDYHECHDSPEISYMMIEVNNSSKGLKWIYAPTYFGYHLDDGEDMIWLCHLKYLGNILEGGDEVTVSIFVDPEFKDMIITFKECNIHVVYEQEEMMSTQSENTTDNLSDVGGIFDYWKNFMEKPATYIIKAPFRYSKFEYSDPNGEYISGLTYDKVKSNKKTSWPPIYYYISTSDEEASDPSFLPPPPPPPKKKRNRK